MYNIILASSDGAARLWDVAEGTVQREYTGHQKAITALALEDIAKE
jgi:target of rapamycin complex subunit LST8